MNAVSALIWMGGARKAYLFFIVISTNTKNITVCQINCSESTNCDGTLPIQSSDHSGWKKRWQLTQFLCWFFMLTLTSLIRQNKVGFFFQLCYLSCESKTRFPTKNNTTWHNVLWHNIFFWFVRYFTLAGFVHCLNIVKDLKIDNFLELQVQYQNLELWLHWITMSSKLLNILTIFFSFFRQQNHFGSSFIILVVKLCS